MKGMIRVRRRRPASLLVLSLLMLCGCEIDYGDRLLDWVNQNAERVSRESANAELRMRWAQGHSSQALATRARLQVLAEAADALRPPSASERTAGSPASTLEALQNEKRRLSDYSDRLQAVRTETEALKGSLVSWVGICTHERFFQENEFSRAGDLTRGLPAQRASGPDGAAFGTTDYLLPKVISDLLQSNRSQRQNERIDEALARARTLSVSSTELRELSRTHCEDELERHRPFISHSLKSLVRMEAALALAVEVLAKRREGLDTRIIPLRVRGREAIVASEWRRQRSVWLAVLADSLSALEKDRTTLRRGARSEKDRLLVEDALAERTEHLLRQAQERTRALGMEHDPEVARAMALLKPTGARP